MLADAATRAPLLIDCDDAQWLDGPTCDVLTFVARRLQADDIMQLIAIRDEIESPIVEAGLPELRLEPLEQTAAEALLDACAPDLLSAFRERLLAEAAGNPLALIELPSALRAQLRQERSTPPVWLPVTARLERAFATRVSNLHGGTRTLLLIAAAGDTATLAEVLKATALLDNRAGAAVDPVTPALDARIVEDEGTGLQFRHPLMRSAIYQAASIAQRRAAHAALAEVLAADPDRRVWQRAAAVLRPHEEIALELDQAAMRARRRRAVAVAIAAEERAAGLSDAEVRRGHRVLHAAEMALELGRRASGLRMLRATDSLDLTEFDRTRLLWLRKIYDNPGGSVDSIRCLTSHMRHDGHVDLAVKYLLGLVARFWWENPDEHTTAEIVAAVTGLDLGDDNPALLAILAHADPVGSSARVIERISRLRPDTADPGAMYLVGSAASAVWAYGMALRFLGAAVDGLRAQGRVALLVQALVAQAWAAVHLAHEPLALSAADEAVRLAQETGELQCVGVAHLAQALISAERGDFERVETLARDAEAASIPTGASRILAMGQFVRGRAAVAHQRSAVGLGYLRRALNGSDPAHHPFVGAWCFSDLIEAALHCDQLDTARTYLSQLELLATSTSGPLIYAELAYARAVIADHTEAEGLYRAALEHDLVAWPCFRARMLLWYGRWLRRQRRLTDSRVPLRAAREIFDALAFPTMAECARQELRASGESSERRTAEGWDLLTPQKLQIAQLAANGLSNREIGQQLFLSHRTVGAHLYRTFPKLGITSRAQIARALSTVGSTDVEAKSA